MNPKLLPFGNLSRKLEIRLQQPLPGEQAHLLMASRLRLQQIKEGFSIRHAIKSAVLILLYPVGEEIRTVLILRPDYDGVHSGQVAFPGGRCEPEDHSAIHTALREAGEEINIRSDQVKVLGTLSDLYIPPSNYLVTPVLATSDIRPDFIPDLKEVSRVIEADIRCFFDESLRKLTILEVRGNQIEAPYFDVQGYVVWGATAMILSELRVVIESVLSRADT